MSAFRKGLLWSITGTITAAGAHKGSARSVVIVANDYQGAHEVAVSALLDNWSSTPHEAVVHAVRPATAEDLSGFKYDHDPCFRVLIPTE